MTRRRLIGWCEHSAAARTLMVRVFAGVTDQTVVKPDDEGASEGEGG
jgi:hypothetical protein